MTEGGEQNRLLFSARKQSNRCRLAQLCGFSAVSLNMYYFSNYPIFGFSFCIAFQAHYKSPCNTPLLSESWNGTHKEPDYVN